MNVCIVYEDKKGNCRIVKPHPKFKQEWEDEGEALGRLWASSIPEISTFIVCSLSYIPQDKTFRDAWKKGDEHEPIKIDFQKAISIHRKRIQEAAERKIRQLDADFAQAVERRNLPDQVAVRRTQEILKTIHEMNVTHCKTVNDLKFCVPQVLHDVWNFYPLT